MGPLLSITFPQGFWISKNLGHPTSRNGGKKTFKRYLKSEHTQKKEKKKENKNLFPYQVSFSLHVNGDTIRIGRDIQCLPYVGFLKFDQTFQKLKSVITKYKLHYGFIFVKASEIFVSKLFKIFDFNSIIFIYSRQHTAHCTLHTAHCTLHTAH